MKKIVTLLAVSIVAASLVVGCDPKADEGTGATGTDTSAGTMTPKDSSAAGTTEPAASTTEPVASTTEPAASPSDPAPSTSGN